MTRAERNIKWIEDYCVVPEGFLVGEPIKLLPFQRDFIKQIYDNKVVTRTAILSIPRKNGKTGLVACLVLLHLVGPEAQPNAYLYSSANSREQAGITFDSAAKMVLMSPSLNSHIKIRDTYKELLCPELGTQYKALSSEAKSAFGLKPAFIVHDELGQVESEEDRMFDALETSTATQKQPLSIIISTQAANDSALLSTLIDDALEGNDPKTVCVLYGVPLDNDVFSDDELRKANPALGIFQNDEELFNMRDAAKRMPSRESSFRNLCANQRVEARSPFISRAIWEACKIDKLPDFGKHPVYVGLDLSSVSDLTAMVALCQIDDIWYSYPVAWVPGENIYEKGKQDRVPYKRWIDQGYLRESTGAAIDYSDLAEDLIELLSRWNIASVGFDQWSFNHLKPLLEKAGMPFAMLQKFEPIIQGGKTMAPALRAWESAVLKGKFKHANNPVYNWCISNAIVTGRDETCRRLDKEKSRGRIDCAVATAVAYAASVANPQQDYSGKTLVSSW